MSVFIIFLVWTALLVVSAMRFDPVRKFSVSERRRLVGLGDKGAIREAEQISDLPLLIGLQFLIRTILAVVLISLTIYFFGMMQGFLVSIILLVLVPVIARIAYISRLVEMVRKKAAPLMRKIAYGMSPVFRWFGNVSDLAQTDQVLNSQAELLELIRRSPGVLSKEEQMRLVANLSFDSKKVTDVMTPKSVIEAVPAKETLGPLVLDELYKTGFSRFPVYEGDIDHIVGMLYLHDLIDVRGSKSRVACDAMQPKVYYIREDRNLSHALHGFLTKKHHLFVVVNSYRETVGLLSLEDVIEALIGKKIVDEFDAFDDLRAVAEENPRQNNQPKSREDI